MRKPHSKNVVHNQSYKVIDIPRYPFAHIRLCEYFPFKFSSWKQLDVTVDGNAFPDDKPVALALCVV
jgi:hypothetical protein